MKLRDKIITTRAAAACAVIAVGMLTVTGGAASAATNLIKDEAVGPAATVTSIVIYKGDGVEKPVGPGSLPAVDTAPETIKAGDDTLHFDVADLQGPWGACKSACSEWDYTASPTQVYVASFTVNGETEHALQSVGIFNPATYWVQNPHGLGAGVWTPICLRWQGGSIKLNLNEYKWSVKAC